MAQHIASADWERTLADVRAQLGDAGYEVSDVVGDWAGSPVRPDSPLLIVTSRAV